MIIKVLWLFVCSSLRVKFGAKSTCCDASIPGVG
jgi:hypothetical protein